MIEFALSTANSAASELAKSSGELGKSGGEVSTPKFENKELLDKPKAPSDSRGKETPDFIPDQKKLDELAKRNDGEYLNDGDHISTPSFEEKSLPDNNVPEIRQKDRLDDNGNVYKDANGELLPNTSYEIGGNQYQTDSQGRIVHKEGELSLSSQERDNMAQRDAGGEDRRPGDDGGHIVANMNGGSSGNENLVSMRDTINRGDYKKGELEENRMLQDGKTVNETVDLEYEGNSKRPSTIEKTYSDGETTVHTKYDNVEGRTDLLNDTKGDISENDYNSLSNEIKDMKADGNDVSVTSVERRYDSNDNLTEVTIRFRNETTGEISTRTCKA